MEKTLKVSLDNIESAVIAWLYAIGEFKDSDQISLFDMGIPIDESGMVSIDVEYTRKENVVAFKAKEVNTPEEYTTDGTAE